MAFIFDPTKGETPESVARKRQIAEALAAGAAGRAPRDIGEGLHSIGQALAYRRMMGQANKAEAAGQEQGDKSFAPVKDRILSLLGGGSPAAATQAAQMDPASARVASAHSASGDPTAYRNAIKSIESAGSGDYAAVGPTHPKLGRALGAYQVMEANIGPWSKEVLGQEITPEQFLADPKLQDQIFDAKFGGYVGKFGSPEKAAQAWFGGEGGVGTNRQDSLGTSVPEYAQKFSAAMGGGAPQMAQAGGGGQGETIQILLQAAQDPWLNENQRGIVNMLLERQMAGPGEGFTLGEGQIRFDANGNPVARGGEKEPAKPSAVQEYEYAKQQGFPGTFQDWEASKKGGMSLTVDPATGQVSFQQGTNIKPLTEGQSKDTVYATRAEGALGLIDQFGDALTSLPEAVGGQVPGVGNYMKSPEFQQAEQAGNEFLQAILRKDTGAAITSQEMAEYGTTYLPRPGDGPEVLAQKKVSRLRALEAIKAGMPAQAILMQEKALANSTPGAPVKKAPIVTDDGYTIEEIE